MEPRKHYFAKIPSITTTLTVVEPISIPTFFITFLPTKWPLCCFAYHPVHLCLFPRRAAFAHGHCGFILTFFSYLLGHTEIQCTIHYKASLKKCQLAQIEIHVLFRFTVFFRLVQPSVSPVLPAICPPLPGNLCEKSQFFAVAGKST